MRTFITLLITVISFASVAVGQSKKDKVEIGVQSTSLTVFPPDIAGDETKAGFGGRVTYNINRSIAAQAEINLLPSETTRVYIRWQHNSGAIWSEDWQTLREVRRVWEGASGFHQRG